MVVDSIPNNFNPADGCSWIPACVISAPIQLTGGPGILFVISAPIQLTDGPGFNSYQFKWVVLDSTLLLVP